MKTKTSKIIFGNLNGIKDYKKLEKLAQAATKLQAKPPSRQKDKKLASLRQEMKELIPEVESGLERVISIYAAAEAAMETGNEIYTKDTAKSFLDELKSMKQSTENYKKEVFL